jgi:hypothetical protein
MGWTTPITWLVNQLVTEADMNAQVSGNITFLGAFEIDGVALSTLTEGTNLGKTLRRAAHPIGFVGDISQVGDETVAGAITWLRGDGRTIGNAASSGADVADDTMLDLFTTLWDNTTNAELVIQDSSGTPTTRGANAAADWTANKRMPIWDFRGNIVGGMDDPTGADAANAITDAQADILGGKMGAETHVQLKDELPQNTLGYQIGFAAEISRIVQGGSTYGFVQKSNAADPMAIIQPIIFLNKGIYTGN